MKRRGFLLLAAALVIAGNPAVAGAPRIGFIAAGSRSTNRQLLAALQGGLGALGWIDRSNLVVLDRWAEEHTERLPGIVKGLIGSGVDVLVAAGTAATLAAASATATIPIVMVGVGDPVALGVVNSLEQPGGNATGLSLNSPKLIAERLHLLQELVPGLHRLAVIIRNDPDLEQKLSDIRNNADRLGLALLELEATTGRTLTLAFTRLRNDRCDAIYVASGPMGPAKRSQIIELASDARLPVIYSYRSFTDSGGLISLAADDNDLFRRAAAFVDRILKGANPAEMPVQQPIKSELVINLQTAKALGLVVPPSILARVDEVIE